MKQLSILFILLTYAITMCGQIQPIGSKTGTVQAQNNLQALGWLAPGVLSDTPTTGLNAIPVGAIVIRAADSTAWQFNGRTAAGIRHWNSLAGAVTAISVNGGPYQSGNVPITIPTVVSQLTNDANYITAAQAPVRSVNGNTGAVVIDGSETKLASSPTAVISGLGTLLSPYQITVIGGGGGGSGANADSIRGTPVDTTGKAQNYAIVFDTTGTAGGGRGFWKVRPISTTYAGLTDVQLTSLSDGQVMRYNNSLGKWVNVTPPWLTTISGITAGGDLSGTYPNPTVSQLNGLAASYYLDYTHLSNRPTSFPPSGAAGGELAGTYPNPTIAKLLGVSLPSLSTGVLYYNGTAWVMNNSFLSGTVAVANGGTGLTTAISGIMAGDGTAYGATTNNYGLSYTPVGRVLLVDTTTGKIATQWFAKHIVDTAEIGLKAYMAANYATTVALADSLALTDTVFTQLPLYVRPAGTLGHDTLAVRNDSAAWNARWFMGIQLSSTAPTDGQVYQYSVATARWVPVTLSGGGSGPTNITVTTSPTGLTINSSTGTPGAFPLATSVNAGAMPPAVFTATTTYTHFANIRAANYDTIAYAYSGGGSNDSIVFKAFQIYNAGGVIVDTTGRNFYQLPYGLKFDTNYAPFQAYVALHGSGLPDSLRNRLTTYTHFANVRIAGADTLAYGVASPDSIVFRAIKLLNLGGVIIDTTASTTTMLSYKFKFDTTYSAFQTYVANHAGGAANPAGSNTQIQYNNSGAFAGSANFTFTAAGPSVAIGTATASTRGQLVLGGASASGTITGDTMYYQGNPIYISTTSTGNIVFRMNGTDKGKIDQNGLLSLVALSTGGTAPATSGTVAMVVTDANGQLSFQSIPAFGMVNPMTAIGQMIYGAAGGTPTALAANTTTTPQVLMETGTGAAGAAPVWHTLVKGDVGLNNVENTTLSTWAGSTAITTLGTIVTGTWSGTAIAAAKGGVPIGGTTGQALVKNSSANYDASWATTLLDPMTTAGDVLYRNGSNVTTRLPVGSSGQIFMVNGSLPAWQNQTQITQVGTITAGTWNGTIIGLLYGGTGTNLNLTGGTSQFLAQSGVGAAVTVRQVQDIDLLLADVTTNNANNGRHGFLPKLSGDATQFLNGVGSWVAPPIASGTWNPFQISGRAVTAAQGTYEQNGNIVTGYASFNITEGPSGAGQYDIEFKVPVSRSARFSAPTQAVGSATDYTFIHTDGAGNTPANGVVSASLSAATSTGSIIVSIYLQDASAHQINFHFQYSL